MGSSENVERCQQIPQTRKSSRHDWVSLTKRRQTRRPCPSVSSFPVSALKEGFRDQLTRSWRIEVHTGTLDAIRRIGVTSPPFCGLSPRAVSEKASKPGGAPSGFASQHSEVGGDSEGPGLV